MTMEFIKAQTFLKTYQKMRKGAIVLTIPFRTEQSYDINQLYSGSFKKQNVEWLHFFFYTAMF